MKKYTLPVILMMIVLVLLCLIGPEDQLPGLSRTQKRDISGNAERNDFLLATMKLYGGAK